MEKRNRTGTLFAAGLITGEALMGIFIGAAIYVSKEREVLALPAGVQIGGALGEWAACWCPGLVGFWMYRAAKGSGVAEVTWRGRFYSDGTRGARKLLVELTDGIDGAP